MRNGLPVDKSETISNSQQMNRILLIALLASNVSYTIAQKSIFETPLSERIANYEIDVTLNTDKKQLTGSEKLTWRNTSADNITELRFHLYLNAFKDENSTFMKESDGGKLRGDRMDKTDNSNWGNIQITSFKTSRKENLYGKMRFIQPDDLNENDETVMQVKLDRPILPNEMIELYIDFKAKLPKIFARTGFAKGYFLVAQWFPKIGVYESAGERYAESGQWNCHQFHANTEFYADFGNYDVRINVPQEFVIGGTGGLVSEIKLKNNRKLLRFYAEDVHDFAWTASPEFVISEQKWKHVALKVMMQPEHEHLAYRYFDAAKKALAYFEKHIGKYPYPTLTMVDPPIAGSGSGGMEYPTFITCGSFWGVGEWGRFQELVTIHEFGHQYFQGMLASNEFEESWLDEGFNQYMEGRIMDESYGNGSQFSLFDFEVSDVASSRQAYVSMKNPKISEVFRYAWKYPKGAYSIMTYTKTATWMRTLENLIGRNVMDEILQTYYQRWRFRHPAGADFIDIVNEVVPKRLGNKFGESMDWYFEQVLYKAPVCDYKVVEISNEEANGVSTFKVEREGEMIIPTEIEVLFKDGSKKLIEWNGRESTKKFSFKKPIKHVWLDPKTKNLMDLNIINNAKSVNQSETVFIKYAAKVLFWAQNFFQLMA